MCTNDMGQEPEVGVDGALRDINPLPEKGVDSASRASNPLPVPQGISALQL